MNKSLEMQKKKKMEQHFKNDTLKKKQRYIFFLIETHFSKIDKKI